jgi:hypothetical protein
MKSAKHLFGLFAGGALALVGCSSAEPGSFGAAEDSAGSTQEALTVGDCGKQVTLCVQGAKSVSELGGCTAKFEACSIQAAADLAGQGNLLEQCRDSADACLQGALTVSDIRSCRSVLQSCVADAATTGTAAVKEAVDLAKSAVDEATTVAIGVIDTASVVGTGAIDAVEICSTEALSCIDRAATVGGVKSCRQSFEVCLGAAIDLVDDAVAVLPIPPVGQIASSLEPCQKNAVKCLSGAVTLADISACRDTLKVCVQSVTSVGDAIASEVNQLLPGIIQIPLPGHAVDCTESTVNCLLKKLTPVQCAADTVTCLVP